MTTAHTPRTIPEFTLGDRLRKARELTGLSVRRFAEEIGVSHGTITNAEGDRRAVRPITINAYAMRRIERLLAKPLARSDFLTYA